MIKHRLRKLGLFVEHLESRRMLAGNVVASRQGDTLFVRGDNASNEVAIVGNGSGGYTVTGVDTTVNRNGEAFFSGIRNINVDLRNGHDILTIADDPTGLGDVAATVVVEDDPIDLDTITPAVATGLEGFLFVRMGSGNDTVALSVSTGLHVDVATGAGNDRVDVLGSDIGTHLFIRGEGGADEVTVLDSSVDTTLLIDLGSGFDAALVQTSDAAQITVNGGNDSDVIGLFDVSAQNHIILLGGNGHDVLELEFAEANYVQLNGGAGNDSIDVDGVDVFGTLQVFGGAGNDDIEVEPNEDYVSEGTAITFASGAILIDGGSGNDSLEAELTESSSLTIIGGAGNDFIDADGVDVHGAVVIIGGEGRDSVEVGASDDDEFDPGIAATIEGFLHVILGGGNDEAFLTGFTVGQWVLLDAGAGNDVVEISSVAANDHIMALMGAGRDLLTYFDNTGSREDLDGGSAFDQLFIDFTTGRRIRNFENTFTPDVELEPV